MSAALSDPIISPSTALIGAGAWFAEKIFGPSAEAIGDQLKVYLQSRLPKIFGVADSKARAEQLSVQPIKPGLLARMVMNASLSDDDAEITDWWANLFVDASCRVANEHVVFDEMMAMLGPKEVQLLDRLLADYLYVLDDIDDAGRRNLSSPEIILDYAISNAVGPLPVSSDGRALMVSGLSKLNLTWPTWALFWSIPIRQDDGAISSPTTRGQVSTEDPLTLQILERAGLLERRRTVVADNELSGWVSTINVTLIGLEFYRACTGRRLGK